MKSDVELLSEVWIACDAKHPVDDRILCNREKGHPGKHCHFERSYGRYNNTWWNVIQNSTQTSQ
jgi:hypothetical protein